MRVFSSISFYEGPIQTSCKIKTRHPDSKNTEPDRQTYNDLQIAGELQDRKSTIFPRARTQVRRGESYSPYISVAAMTRATITSKASGQIYPLSEDGL